MSRPGIHQAFKPGARNGTALPASAAVGGGEANSGRKHLLKRSPDQPAALILSGPSASYDPRSNCNERPQDRGLSTEPTPLPRWRKQLTIDEPWSSQAPGSSSRRTLRNSALLNDKVPHLQPLNSGFTDNGVTKSERDTKRDAGGREVHKRGVKADNKALSVGGTKKSTYAEVARCAPTPRVRHGESMFSADGSPLFVCFCCKRRRFIARSRGGQTHAATGSCRPVKQERSCCRTSAGRHIGPKDGDNNGANISQQQYEALNRQDPGRAPGASALPGLEAEKDRWRDHYVSLYPAYASVKADLDPFDLDEPALTDEEVRQREEAQRLRDFPVLPSPQAAHFSQAPYQGFQVMSDTPDPNPVPSLGQPPIFSGSGSLRRLYAEVVAAQRSPLPAGVPPVGNETAHAQTLFPQHADNPQAHAFNGTQHVNTSPNSSAFACPPHAIRPQGILGEQGRSSSFLHQQPLTQLALPWLPSNTDATHIPSSTSHLPTVGSSLPEPSEHAALSASGHRSQSNPTTFLTPPRQIRSARQSHSDRSTGHATSSSQRLSVPSLGYDLSSTRTGDTSFAMPPTPGGPDTPTPAQSFEGELAGMARNDGTIDPRLLDKNFTQIIPDEDLY